MIRKIQLSAVFVVQRHGGELDLLADLTERWVVNLSYAYNDAKVIEAGTNGITDAAGRASMSWRNTV